MKCCSRPTVVMISLVMSLLASAQENRAFPQPSNPAASRASGSQETSTATPDANNPGFNERYPRYQLKVNDLLEVEFALSPEFNQTAKVQPDGYISLKNVGSLHVQGETIPEVTDNIIKAYGNVLHNPIVAVVLKEFEKPYFIATGEVNRPGKYDLIDDTTVVQALAMAGGINKDAKHSQVLLFRRVNKDWFEVKELNVKQMLNSRNLAEDLHLRPGDMVYVPKNMISKLSRFVPNVGTGLTYNPAP